MQWIDRYEISNWSRVIAFLMNDFLEKTKANGQPLHFAGCPLAMGNIASVAHRQELGPLTKGPSHRLLSVLRRS